MGTLRGLPYPRAVLFSMGLLLLACHRKDAGAMPPAAVLPPRPALGDVTVQDTTPPNATPPASVDFDRLRDSLRARLAQSGLFASPDAGAPVAVVRVRVDVALDGAEVEDKG